MSRRDILAYVVRHTWLWPLRFWLRPLAVVHEGISGQFWAVLWSAELGASVWGLAVGAVLHRLTGDSATLWVTPLSFALCTAVSAALDRGVAVTSAVIGAVAVAGIGAGTATIAIPIAGAAAVSGVQALANVVGGARGEEAFVFALMVTFMGVGIAKGAWLDPGWALLGLGAIGAAMLLLGLLHSFLYRGLPNSYLLMLMWVFGIPLASFALLPSAPVSQSVTWGAVLMAAVVLGWQTGYFAPERTIGRPYFAFSSGDLRGVDGKGRRFLIGLWLVCSGLATAAWALALQNHDLAAKLDTIALFLIAIPPLVTALPLYPLFAVLAWRQSQPAAVAHLADPDRLLVLRLQVFAYPLPGHFDLLRETAASRGVTAAVRLLQRIQTETLQERHTARAALRLADSPDWALPFCGEVAVLSNTATLAPLALAGDAGRAVAVLARTVEKEDEQPLRLFFGDFPPRETRWTALLTNLPGRVAEGGRTKETAIEQFRTIRTMSLAERLAYARERLTACQGYAQSGELDDLLRVLAACAGAPDLQSLEALDLSSPQTTPGWLAGGWSLLSPFQGLVGQLPEYRRFTQAEIRRRFLKGQSDLLSQADWKDLPEYWGNLARELAAHWVGLLSAESAQAREWLHILVDLPPQRLHMGQQLLIVRVRNASAAAARGLRLRVEQADAGLHCAAADLAFPIPLEPGEETRLQFPFSCIRPGTYLIRGAVTATDLDGHESTAAFAERLDIGQPGRPYRQQEVAPYVAGEGLGDDRTFVERGELRHRIKALWRQPGGKPAVLLTGQRRIGKSTLLNKIARDGLEDCGLWPVKLDLQGCNTPLGLWRDLARGIAQPLGQPAPLLSASDPFADFKSFLLGRRDGLRGRRLVLLLDESERLWTRIRGDAPDNLRHLMQGHEYPVLVLFCGTQALKRLGADYDSALFNTCHPYELGYMSESESREVLVRPAQGILDYDPAALELAYRLTQGQPYLLQLLGTVIIERFDSAVLNGEVRGDYVGLRDLEDAAADLVRRGNSAFDGYWSDADPQTRALYATLAHVTDEGARPRLDRDGIALALREQRLALAATDLFERLERLSEDGFLVSEGPTYRFAVPLLRRWLAWRWPPEKLRAGGILRGDGAA